MAQVIVFSHDQVLTDERREALSAAIHGAVMSALDYPADKKFHRFVRLAEGDFLHPADRGPDYTIIEISLFEGRSDAAKRALIAALFANLRDQVGIDPHSVEITLTETPKLNWGIRGLNAEDLALGYTVEV